LRVGGQQTVLDAQVIASPMVVTWFAKGWCQDGLVRVGVTVSGRSPASSYPTPPNDR
jgi:hypothetical protein